MRRIAVESRWLALSHSVSAAGFARPSNVERPCCSSHGSHDVDSAGQPLGARSATRLCRGTRAHDGCGKPRWESRCSCRCGPCTPSTSSVATVEPDVDVEARSIAHGEPERAEIDDREEQRHPAPHRQPSHRPPHARQLYLRPIRELASPRLASCHRLPPAPPGGLIRTADQNSERRAEPGHSFQRRQPAQELQHHHLWRRRRRLTLGGIFPRAGSPHTQRSPRRRPIVAAAKADRSSGRRVR